VPHSPANDDDNQPEQELHDHREYLPIEGNQFEQDDLGDDQDASDPPHHNSTPEPQNRPSSPQAGSKRGRSSDSDTDSDEAEVDAHITKALKGPQKSTRPKAGDFDDFGRDLVLSAANLYRALLASQGAFPDTTLELKLIKKSWNKVIADNGVKPLTLTPSIVTIVSNLI
jgi:hypothetical protein